MLNPPPLAALSSPFQPTVVYPVVGGSVQHPFQGTQTVNHLCRRETAAMIVNMSNKISKHCIIDLLVVALGINIPLGTQPLL